jgi:hypothetical protein
MKIRETVRNVGSPLAAPHTASSRPSSHLAPQCVLYTGSCVSHVVGCILALNREQ